ncbi:hypothetical protein CEXT_217021 [Caerostris extrusa]|uniref:Uncharacterized protein n=1 Tax=Caerostris extrusa TaxID=172846 RepID=A0AAV4X218_CAEEX|nr:hypothetical protein CEXT_217021 [Caerostris extrusa]
MDKSDGGNQTKLFIAIKYAYGNGAFVLVTKKRFENPNRCCAVSEERSRERATVSLFKYAQSSAQLRVRFRSGVCFVLLCGEGNARRLIGGFSCSTLILGVLERADGQAYWSKELSSTFLGLLPGHGRLAFKRKKHPKIGWGMGFRARKKMNMTEETKSVMLSPTYPQLRSPLIFRRETREV